MLKKILLGLVVVVVILLGVIASRPATFEVSRSLEMNAPASVVYAQISDFKAWQGWSPWEAMDPSMKRTFGEPSAGLGAGYSWVGNDQVGEGKMTITEARADESLGIDLEFIKPFASKARNNFALSKAGEGTKVTWQMSGKNDFMGKAFSLVMDMDKSIGADFEKGLAKMKTVSENAAAEAAAAAAAEPADPGAP